jgi:large subunit ribosomal protein L10
MSKVVKDMIAADLKSRIGDCRDFVVVDPSKLDGVTNNTLRLKLRAQNIRMFCVKNTLAKRTLGEIGLGGLAPYLEGHSVLVWGGPDIVALSKEISKWTKDLKEKLVVKGGVVDGTGVSAKEVDEISKGPSREELIGKIVMLALSPASQIAGALLGAGGVICGQVKSIAEKEPAGEAAAEPAAAS